MPKMKVWNGTAWITLDANDADTVDGKHASDFAPSSHVGSGGSAHAVATSSVAGFMSASDKSKLDGIQAGAEVNQNAFSNVKIGNTTITADSKTDTLELVAGSNITLTPDEVNDKVTISATAPVTSVNGRTGAVSLTASDVGASPTGHTHTFAELTNKPTTLGGYGITDAIPISQKGTANGVASLDGNVKVPISQLPSASTVSAGIVQLNDTVSSTSTTQAATANAVKQVNDALASHSVETASKFTNINLNIIDMAVELETLKGATLNGVTANIFVETFTDLNDINLMKGIYDSTNKRLVL